MFTNQFALFQIPLSIFVTLLDFSKPYFINRLLVFIQYRKPEDDLSWGFVLLIGMLVTSILRQIIKSQVELCAKHWGIQLRAVLVYEIFRKSLRKVDGQTSDSKNGKASHGKIVNLMSSDVNQIRHFLTDFQEIIIDMPLSIVMSITGLLVLMGTPALSG